MKRSLVSMAVQAACTGQHPADARDTDAGWWQHQGPPAMTGVRFQPSPPPLHESYVTIVHSEPNWIEQLRAPADLEPGDTPLYRGEIGTLDCGYTFKPSRPPALPNVHVKFFTMEHGKMVDDQCGVREYPMDAVLAAMPADPHCAMKPQCPGALGKGCYLCEPGPFDAAFSDRATLDGLEVEVSPLLFEMPTMGAEWSGVPGDPFINLERVRRTPHGGEPWDHASTEAA